MVYTDCSCDNNKLELIVYLMIETKSSSFKVVKSKKLTPTKYTCRISCVTKFAMFNFGLTD